jgi:putative CocE/NonD family hydrolase
MAIGATVVLLLLTSALAAQDSAIVVDTNVAVPMRDGVMLRADVWRPRDSLSHPVLVYRTPYGKHQATLAFAFAAKAVARGYAVVLQDVRGRYASAGDFAAYSQEGHDGYDTIEWAARQSWSNGAVGTFGLSYPGAIQWLAAIESPPHLKAMVPAMTFASPMQFWYSGGVWDLSWITWIYHNVAPDRRVRMDLVGPRTYAEADSLWPVAADSMRNAIPLRGMHSFDLVAPWYYDWLRHPAYDPWWSWAELRGKYGRTNAAVLNFSGWYDDAYGPDGATKNYMGLVAARRGQPARTAMIIGPWQHGVPRMNRTSVGARGFGPNGIVDYDSIVLGWMDRFVRDIDNGVDRQRSVRVFVLGSNQWIEADAWPIPGTRLDTVSLTRSGRSTTITSDPADPVRDQFADSATGAHDYRALTERKDIVVFETPPLDSDLTVVGPMQAYVYASANAPDFDLYVLVFDVAPDSTAFNLMSPGLAVLRASYRDRATHQLLARNTIYRLTLDNLLTGNTFLRGHRIRVVVAPSFFPDFSRNLQNGNLESSFGKPRSAQITIYHDRAHPTRLILPILPRSLLPPS